MNRLISKIIARIDSMHIRNKRIGLGIVTGIVTKGVSIILTLSIVSIAFNHVGAERYGIWVTIFSIFAWLGLMDLGIANGLTPALSGAFGSDRKDLAGSYIATAFWGLSGISLVGLIILAGVWEFANLGGLFNASSSDVANEAVTTVFVGAIIFLLTLPLTINQRVLLAYQEGAIANGLQLLVSLSGFGGIFIAVHFDTGLPLMIAGFLGFQWIAQLLVSLWLFGIHKPYLRPGLKPQWVQGRMVLGLGGLLFLLQLATLFVYQKDNILITYLIGPKEAASYAIIWQMFLYVNVVSSLISQYIAPGFGEAYAKKDIAWLRLNFWRFLLLNMGIAISLIVVIDVAYIDIVRLWIGTDININPLVVYWLGGFALVLSILAPVVSVLIGIGKLKIYTIFSLIAALFSFVLSIALIKSIGSYGAAMASTLSFLILVVVPGYIEVGKILEVRFLSIWTRG